MGFVQSFDRCLLSIYYVPFLELHIGVTETDVGLPSRIPPLCSRGRHLSGRNWCAGGYHTGALCLREDKSCILVATLLFQPEECNDLPGNQSV